MKLGIVAIGYNRVKSMERLLKSLSQCEYGQDRVTLIISIDRWKTNEVEQCANEFQWDYGDKIVKSFSERQGLRKHILKCGDYMDEYGLDAIAVFEDDIMPSVGFYQYMRQAVKFYEKEEGIAGIGLYSFQWHPIANKPFVPMQGKASVYLSKFAVSWGQVWLKKQWNDFRQWLQGITDERIEHIRIPEAVKQWKNSWLKYHIAYCSDQQKYFVYPYKPLATYFSEQGEHTNFVMNHFQVPMVEEAGENYSFLKVDDIQIRYDSFFESEYLYKALDKAGYTACIDLYGLKNNAEGEKFWLTGEEKPYELVKSYGLVLKPHEKNALCQIEGRDIFLYNSNKKIRKESKRLSFNENRFLYYFNGLIDKRYFMLQIKKKILSKIGRRFCV